MSDAPVLIIAGGTGGHVFPALAAAERFRDAGVPVVWMGTSRGLEARLVPEAGIELISVDVCGLRGKGWFSWLMAPLMLARALLQACRGMRRLAPRVVLGMGGYVSGPGAVAAWLLRRPLVVHEQNAIPGLTNRWTARLARQVLTGFDRPFPGASGARFVGNPVREAVCALPGPETRLAERTGSVRILVLGGSLGARTLNEVIPPAIATLALDKRPEVRHQAGEATEALARKAYDAAGVDAEVTAFIPDIATAYAWADLVICRAGALTVAEVAVAGLAAVFVPFPHAVDDHQAANAAVLVDSGAALMIREAELENGALARTLTGLVGDRPRLLDMARRARACGRPQAATAVTEACLEAAR